MAKTARDIMTQGAECVGESQSLVDAARKMRDLDVGALPVCGTTTGSRAWSPTGTS